ncbi:helix-turn-helix domain-containing protein [Comamonas aquatica]
MAVAGRSVREIAAELDVGKSTVARWIAVPSP